MFAASRRRKTILAIVVAGLFLWSWEPFAWLFAGTLEWRYPARSLPVQDAGAIVVLSAGAYLHNDYQPDDLADFATYTRCSYASWLYKNWRALPVLASGGGFDEGARSAILSEIMRRLLVQQGVPDAMVWTEPRSRNTYENAVESAALLRARGIRRIALVTEARHMPRAERAFRRQGLEVLAAPCGYQQFPAAWTQWIPSATGIWQNETTLHEWIGIVWYRVTGKI